MAMVADPSAALMLNVGDAVPSDYMPTDLMENLMRTTDSWLAFPLDKQGVQISFRTLNEWFLANKLQIADKIIDQESNIGDPIFAFTNFTQTDKAVVYYDVIDYRNPQILQDVVYKTKKRIKTFEMWRDQAILLHYKIGWTQDMTLAGKPEFAAEYAANYLHCAKMFVMTIQLAVVNTMQRSAWGYPLAVDNWGMSILPRNRTELIRCRRDEMFAAHRQGGMQQLIARAAEVMAYKNESIAAIVMPSDAAAYLYQDPAFTTYFEAGEMGVRKAQRPYLRDSIYGVRVIEIPEIYDSGVDLKNRLFVRHVSTGSWGPYPDETAGKGIRFRSYMRDIQYTDSVSDGLCWHHFDHAVVKSLEYIPAHGMYGYGRPEAPDAGKVNRVLLAEICDDLKTALEIRMRTTNTNENAVLGCSLLARRKYGGQDIVYPIKYFGEVDELIWADRYFDDVCSSAVSALTAGMSDKQIADVEETLQDIISGKIANDGKPLKSRATQQFLTQAWRISPKNPLFTEYNMNVIPQPDQRYTFGSVFGVGIVAGVGVKIPFTKGDKASVDDLVFFSRVKTLTGKDIDPKAIKEAIKKSEDGGRMQIDPIDGTVVADVAEELNNDGTRSVATASIPPPPGPPIFPPPPPPIATVKAASATAVDMDKLASEFDKIFEITPTQTKAHAAPDPRPYTVQRFRRWASSGTVDDMSRALAEAAIAANKAVFSSPLVAYVDVYPLDTNIPGAPTIFMRRWKAACMRPSAIEEFAYKMFLLMTFDQDQIALNRRYDVNIPLGGADQRPWETKSALSGCFVGQGKPVSIMMSARKDYGYEESVHKQIYHDMSMNMGGAVPVPSSIRFALDIASVKYLGGKGPGSLVDHPQLRRTLKGVAEDWADHQDQVEQLISRGGKLLGDHCIIHTLVGYNMIREPFEEVYSITGHDDPHDYLAELDLPDAHQLNKRIQTPGMLVANYLFRFNETLNNATGIADPLKASFDHRQNAALRNKLTALTHVVYYETETKLAHTTSCHIEGAEDREKMLRSQTASTQRPSVINFI
jgi:hypothetical protein